MGIINADNLKYLKDYILRRLNLFAIILLIVWISLFPPPIQQRYHLATKIFLALVFGSIFIKKHISIFKWSDFPLWFFLVAIGMNVLFAQQKNIALRTYMDLAIPIFLLYYSVSNIFSSESRFKLLAITICILSILVSLIGIIESFFAVNPIYKYFVENSYYQRYITGFVRPMSTQFHTVTLGSYLMGTLPFNFFLFTQTKSFFRLLGALGMVLNTVVVFLTFSRGALFGVMAMVAFYLFAQKKYGLTILFFIIFLVFVIICSYLAYPFNRFGKEGITQKDGGVFSDYMFNRYNMICHIIRDHPLTGLGFQHIRIRFDEYYPGQEILPSEFMFPANRANPDYLYSNRDALLYEFMIADNMYLTILGETGIIGFLGFFIFIFFLSRNAWRKLRILEYNSKSRQTLLVIFSSLLGFLINMCGYDLFYWPNQYLYFCILVGLLGIYFKNNKGMAVALRSS